LVVKVSRERSSKVSVECHASITALSRADPGPAHRLADLQARTGGAEQARGVLAAAVGVHDHAGYLASAHGHRHRQRPVGQLRVVVFRQREPHYPS
jgi:hypothetical protein